MSQPMSIDPNVVLKMAEDFSARGLGAEAVEHYRWAAAILWSQGQIQRALSLYGLIAERLPHCLHTKAMIAEAHRWLGDGERAAHLYEEIAQIHACAGRWAEALSVYDFVFSFAPNQPARRARHADLLVHLGRHEAAVEQLEAAANALRAAGDLPGFIELMERRLQIGPDDRAIRSALVRACLELDRLPGAACHLQAMLNAAPHDPAAKLLYAELYARRGQLQLAADTVCAVVRKLIRKRQDARAAKLLRRALSWAPHHAEARRLQSDLDDGRDVTEIAEDKMRFFAGYPQPRAMTLHAADDLVVSGQFIA